MLNNLSKNKVTLNNRKELDSPFLFASIGIACHAIIIINKTNIFDTIRKQGFLKKSDISDKPLIISAINALENANVLVENNKNYFLTDLGISILDQIGLFTILFEGYAEFLAKQTSSLEYLQDNQSNLINGEALAVGSEAFGEKSVDPILLPLLKTLNLEMGICDLGCGSGYRLHKVCKALNLPGLGIDLNKEAIELCKKRLKQNSSIPLSFYQSNITKLDKQWPEIEVVMQHFMTHDIHPSENSTHMLKSFLYHFPNMQYCIIVDIVSGTSQHKLPFPMPGFEYVHGLQNFMVNNYSEIISIFKNAGFEIIREIQLTLPSTYLWLLKPQKRQ